MTVPQEAITLADDVLQRAGACVSREDTREALAAAAPRIAKAERERLHEAFARIQELAGILQEAAVRRAVAAERQRLKQEILGCTTCGSVHPPRPVTDSEGNRCGTSWAAPDGHSYGPRLLAHSTTQRDWLTKLLDTP